jgi:hypothetical protein
MSSKPERGIEMRPLYEDPHFTSCFSGDWLVPRFRLEGVEAGRCVSVFEPNPATGERSALLATATVNEAGWIVVR